MAQDWILRHSCFWEDSNGADNHCASKIKKETHKNCNNKHFLHIASLFHLAVPWKQIYCMDFFISWIVVKQILYFLKLTLIMLNILHYFKACKNFRSATSEPAGKSERSILLVFKSQSVNAPLFRRCHYFLALLNFLQFDEMVGSDIAVALALAAHISFLAPSCPWIILLLFVAGFR